MLILMEEIFVLAHVLRRVGGGGCRQLTLIRQRRHLCRDRFGGFFIGIVGGESTKRILLE